MSPAHTSHTMNKNLSSFPLDFIYTTKQKQKYYYSFKSFILSIIFLSGYLMQYKAFAQVVVTGSQ